MNTSNYYDSIEQLIFKSGLRISSIVFFKEQDKMALLLNSGILLSYQISNYKVLSKATPVQLANYRLIGNGTGIHWPDIDEDLSLKGFLMEELKKLVGFSNKTPDGNTSYAMAA